MNISRLMTYDQQIEGDTPMEQDHKNKNARIGNYEYYKEK